MRDMRLLTVMTAMVFVAAGSARGSTSPGAQHLDSAVVAASGQGSVPMMSGEQSRNETILQAAKEFTGAQLFVAATSEDGKDDGGKYPPPRSVHCPPDQGDHHDFNNQDNGQKSGDNQDKDKDKDKDHHDNCGKGDDGKNP